jgi:hypothetical protein
MAAPTVGYGTTINFATTSFTARIEDINLANPTRNDIETTHMGSAFSTSPVGLREQVWQEFIPGIANAGEMSFDIQYDEAIRIPIDEPAEVITVTFASNATFVCTGYVNACPTVVPVQDKMTATITIKWTGVPVWSA